MPVKKAKAPPSEDDKWEADMLAKIKKEKNDVCKTYRTAWTELKRLSSFMRVKFPGQDLDPWSVVDFIIKSN